MKYIGGVLIMTATCSSPVCALSTTPDKPQTVSISLGAEFASGKYGTDTTTRSVYMPLIATWSPNDRFDIGIEVPFLYQSNSNVTTDLYRYNQQSITAAATVAKGGPGGTKGAFLQQGAGGVTAFGSSSDVAGLGDIILRLGVIALSEGTAFPQIRPSLFVKFPSANKSDGLGTGEFDAGVGFELTKWFGEVHLTGEGLYTYQGKADGFGLKNYFSYTGGIGYQLTENIEPMVMVNGATAPSDYSSELLELRARLIWSLTHKISLDLYGSKGLADSSPEYGGGIAVIYSF
jgi:long-subunit fatty acid transport protein